MKILLINDNTGEKNIWSIVYLKLSPFATHQTKLTISNLILGDRNAFVSIHCTNTAQCVCHPVLPQKTH